MENRRKAKERMGRWRRKEKKKKAHDNGKKGREL